MRLDETMVALDLELTGLDAATDAIIEIAAVKFRAGKVVDRYHTLVNPRRPLPPRIQRLTGISAREVSQAPVFAAVAQGLRAFLREFPLVGHSIENDVAFLSKSGLNLGNMLIDTFELTNILMPSLAGRGLQAIADELVLGDYSFHRAQADAEVSMQLYQYLVERALELDLSVVQEIVRVGELTGWPLLELFRAVERELSLNVFSGSSLRQVLAAKRSLEEASLDNVFSQAKAARPLVPNDTIRPVEAKQLAGMLEPGGAFSRQEGFEHRPQQVEMLTAVVESLNEGQTLVVEAGTGTGKSLAYLLPAARFASLNNERVVISTKTLNLQDQLFQKDIPALQDTAGFQFKAALLKGRNNYLCLRRYAGERKRAMVDPEEAGALIKILAWLPTTATGDWTEMSFTNAEKSLWSRLNAASEHCIGPRCQHFRNHTCFLYRARAEAAAAHLIVVNHALLLSAAAEGGALPEYHYLVIDEAHNLEDVATEQLSSTIGSREVNALIDEVSRENSAGGRSGLLADFSALVRTGSVPAGARRELEAAIESAHQLADVTRSAANRFASSLHQILVSADDRGGRLRVTGALRQSEAWEEGEVAWERLELAAVELESGLRKLTTIVASGGGTDADDDLMAAVNAVEAVLDKLTGMRELGGAMVGRNEKNWVQWLEVMPGRTEQAVLRSAPITVAEVIQQQLFNRMQAVILTSATLSIAGSFDYFNGTLGLEGARTLQLDSPFDYRSRAVLLIPADIAEPQQPGHQKQLETAIAELCRASQGRALILFTSHSQLATTYRAIGPQLQRHNILTMAQRLDGSSRNQLLRAFRSNPRTVLLGTASFWEGVDVVGEALSLLVIAKLPFAVPTDPVVAARSELFEEPFNHYMVPQAVLKTKQGFGRLIRSARDRGVVVFLDRRVVSKYYGSKFLKSLPEGISRVSPLAELPAIVGDWLAKPDELDE